MPFLNLRFDGLGVVATVDTPLLLITEQAGDTLDLAVADPDLRLEKWGHNMSFMPREIVHAEGQPHTASITLSGDWKLDKPVEGVELLPMIGKTQLKVTLQHGLTKELLLTKD